MGSFINFSPILSWTLNMVKGLFNRSKKINLIRGNIVFEEGSNAESIFYVESGTIVIEKVLEIQSTCLNDEIKEANEYGQDLKDLRR